MIMCWDMHTVEMHTHTQAKMAGVGCHSPCESGVTCSRYGVLQVKKDEKIKQRNISNLLNQVRKPTFLPSPVTISLTYPHKHFPSLFLSFLHSHSLFLWPWSVLKHGGRNGHQRPVLVKKSEGSPPASRSLVIGFVWADAESRLITDTAKCISWATQNGS